MTPDPVRIAAQIEKRGATEMDRVIAQIEFDFRRLLTSCMVCGARLQDGRCPWAKLATPVSADGRIYCGWPRTAAPAQIAMKRDGRVPR